MYDFHHIPTERGPPPCTQEKSLGSVVELHCTAQCYRHQSEIPEYAKMPLGKAQGHTESNKAGMGIQN